MKYGVIRGRHRLLAAQANGIDKMRCDVHYGNGRVQLRQISVSDLFPDPDVQRDFSLNEGRLKKMKKEYRPEVVGVLDVTPLDGDNSIVPAEMIRMIKGEMVGFGGGTGRRNGMGRHIAAALRKKARLATVGIAPTSQR